jgi:MFS family permease
MMFGSAGIVIWAFLLSQLSATTSNWHIVIVLSLMGLSAGLVMPVTQVIIQGAVSQAQQGVAASARQFFLQIAQVMGLAILGLVFTTSYTSGFTRASASFGQQLPPAAYAAFQADPTVSLDARRFEPVKETILAQPNGQQLLDQTITAQREGVAHGIDNIFRGTTAAAAIILVITFMLREITLRRSFHDAPAPEAIAAEVG